VQTSSRIPRGRAIFTLGLLFFILGCGDSRPEGMPDLHPVTLEFTQRGTPLTGATVILTPMDPSARWVSGGSTGTNGKAQLRTHGEYDGVPAGKYKVCVAKIETQGQEGLMDMKQGLPPAGNPTTAKAFTLVDPQYRFPNKTPLEIEVPAAGNRYEPFDLGEAVRIEERGPSY
jgi:hypothetical protein